MEIDAFSLEVWLHSLIWVGALCLCSIGLAVLWTRRIVSKGVAKENLIFRVDKKFYAEINSEIRRAVLSLTVRALFFATLITFGLISFHEFSLLKTVAIGLVTFLWTEVWFYGAHRLLHTKYLYFIHRPHHLGQVTRPLTGSAFGVIETLIILVGNSLPLIFFSAYLDWLSLGFFVPFMVFKDLNNFLDHMNIDLYPKDYMSSWKSRIFNSPTYHALHHARYKGNYAQSSPWLDRLFGTMYLDTPWAFAQVKSGQGLSRVNQRQPTSLRLTTHTEALKEK